MSFCIELNCAHIVFSIALWLWSELDHITLGATAIVCLMFQSADTESRYISYWIHTKPNVQTQHQKHATVVRNMESSSKLKEKTNMFWSKQPNSQCFIQRVSDKLMRLASVVAIGNLEQTSFHSFLSLSDENWQS